MSVDYAWTYLNSYYAWFVLSVSSLPLSVIVRSCHVCVNLRVVFVPWASFALTLRSGSSPSPTRQRCGHIRMHETNRLRSFKFTVYGCKQTDIHTTSANAVTLVWGSLRLAPIIESLNPFYVWCFHFWTKCLNSQPYWFMISLLMILISVNAPLPPYWAVDGGYTGVCLRTVPQ